VAGCRLSRPGAQKSSLFLGGWGKHETCEATSIVDARLGRHRRGNAGVGRACGDSGRRLHGKDRWHRFSYLKNSRITSAQVDPAYDIPLDKDLYNNSVLKPGDHAARNKLTHYWIVFVQFLSQLLAWLT